MDRNEFTMPMDVKLDLNERKADIWQLRTWTRCLVKVEAVKCFPCYVKITFTRCDDKNVLIGNQHFVDNDNQFNNNLVVKINIPGLTVELASSRTKTYSYGLFWKNNRKRCTIFLALDTQINCERHMKWIRKSVKNLELHRREILETRRNSRHNILDDSLANLSIANESTTNDGASSIFNDTQIIRDINDKLGPLPDLPDSSINWSRRISGFSGIYEEIADSDASVNNKRKSSRSSVASGIYEVMRSPLDAVIEQSSLDVSPSPLPPPLPPRSRTNTDEGESFHRSYTNPESATFIKRGGLFDNVFWRHKRSESYSNDQQTISTNLCSSSNCNSDYVLSPHHRQPSHLIINSSTVVNKRNSFSSPDLFDAKHFENNFLVPTTPNHSTDSVDNKSINNDDDNDDRRNVSEDILSTYNMSCDLSTINLVGAKLAIDSSCSILPTQIQQQNRNSRVIEDVSGYCAMAPVIHSVSVLEFQKHLNEAPLHNNDNSGVYIEPNRREYITDTPNSSNVTFRRDYSDFIDNNESLLSPSTNPNIVYTFSDSLLSDQSSANNTPSSAATINVSPEEFIYKSPYTGITISKDDKYPSYYPNPIGNGTSSIINNDNNLTVAETVEKILSKKRKKPLKNSTKRVENVYVPSPQKTPITKTTKSPTISLTIESTNDNLVTSTISCPLIEIETPTTPKTPTPRLYKKYATLTRTTPKNRYTGSSGSILSVDGTETNVANTGSELKKSSSDIGNTLKRFASLPRFRKIDFSPLKIKLNNVLHRQNSDNNF